MLLHPATLDLLPRAAEVVEAAADARVKVELPAAQLELSLPPAPSGPRPSPASPPGGATSPPPRRRSGGSPPPGCTRSPPRWAS